MYGPYLTLAEIKAKYPNEWVLLAKPTTTRVREVTGGHVVLHAADRAEYLRLVSGWENADPDVRHFASLWTGEITDDEEILPPSAEAESGAA